jgi:hypothetical protein
VISTAAVRRVLPAAFGALAVVAMAVVAAAFSAASPARADTPYSVSGTVTAQSTELGTATPQAGIVVRLYAEPSGTFVDATTTAGDGSYVIPFTPVDPTADYSLQFNCSDPEDVACNLGYTTQWLGGHGTQSAADTFTLSPDVTDATRDVLLDSASGNGAVELDSPSISGVPSVGQVLQANLASAIPADPTLTYRWFSNGTVVQQGAGDTYTVQPSDFGQQISATITGSAFGYSPTDATTSPTSSVNGIFTPGLPTITAAGGSFVVGSTLTADAGTWTPSGATFSYQWLSNDTVVQDGPDATYTPTPADDGNTITVKVTASEAGYDSSSATSAATDQIGDGALIPGSVTINPDSSGLVVGATLTATSTAWAPGDLTLAYQWVRGAVGDTPATDIPGATDSTYTLGASDYGAPISVRVTGSESGFTSLPVVSAETTPIAAGALNSPPIATIDDTTPTFGDTLNATTGSWGPGDVTLSCEWFRDGVDTNVTTCNYPVGLADVGKPLHVVITGSEPGYISASSTSADTANVAKATLVTTQPTITGAATFGNTLQANTTNWGPGTVTLSYDWFRDGVDTNVTTPDYPLGLADIGKPIHVVVTGSEPGYVSASRTSDDTVNVASASLTSVKPTISGTPTFGNTLHASTTSWGPGTVTLTYDWFRDGVDTNVTAPDYPLGLADIGKPIHVVVTGSEPGYTSASRTSDDTANVATASLTSVKPTILGTPTFGNTLNATTASWGPGTVVVTFEWFRNNVDTGRSGASYPLTDKDLNATMSVRATGIEAGYTTAIVDSDQTSAVAPAAFASLPAQSLTMGSAKLLTMHAVGWAPRPDSYVYRFYRDGVLVETDSSPLSSYIYRPTAADVGHSMTASVQGILTGYLASPVFGPSPLIPTIALFPNATVDIAGTAQVGQALTATVSGWGTAPTSEEFVWKLGDCNAGPILRDVTVSPVNSSVGADSYTIVGADVDQSICVRITAKAPLYNDGAAPVTATSTAVAAGAMTLGTVTITGVPTFGQVLTATPGNWIPSHPTFSYQWLRGSVQVGTGATYTLGQSDIGQRLTVTVTAMAQGYAPSAASVASPTIAAAAFGSRTAPTITGTAQVGSTLTASVAPWNPVTGFDYAWYRDGSLIGGATQNTYVPTPGDIATAISVRVTPTKTGYDTTPVVSVPTAAVITGAFGTAPRPTVSGTARVGSPLTAHPGTWSPAAADFSYQWSVGGIHPAAGGNSETYVPLATDRGKTITVVVTASSAGYVDKTSAPSAATAKVAIGTMSPTTPTVSGTRAVGRILTATVPGWPAGSHLGYQWYRSGSAISHATNSTYLTSASDYKHTISVRVSGSLSGYTSTSRTSHSTAAIAAGTITRGASTITGVAVYPATLTANRGTWGPGSISFSYQWYYKTGSGTHIIDHAITNAVHSTYTPSSAYAGLTIWVRIRGAKSGYTTATTSPSVLYAKGTFTTVKPTISGTVKVGSTLTASRGAWAPTSSVTFTYQWYSGSTAAVSTDRTAISGATKSTFVVPSSLKNKYLWVSIRSSRSGFTTAGPIFSDQSVVVAP